MGAKLNYELHDLGKSEKLHINGEIIIDAWGDVSAWGSDYHSAICGLHGAAKNAATDKYLKSRAERLIIQEIFSLRETIKDMQAD